MSPVKSPHASGPAYAVWRPPSWMAMTNDWMCCHLRSRFTSAFAVAASGRKSRPATPDGVTIVGVPWSTRPMNATLDLPNLRTTYGGRIGRPEFAYTTLPARYWNAAPWYG